MSGRIRWAHVVVVLTAASVLQTGIFDQTSLFGRIRIDLLILVMLGIGFATDQRTAALLGFVTGLTVDLFRFGPFGLHALLFCLAGWLLATGRDRMLQAGSSFRTVQGAIAAATITGATWIGAAVFGQTPPPFDNETLLDLLLIAIVGGLFVHPADRIGQWMVISRISRGIPRKDMVRVE